jgi:hypothetical protein
MLVPNSANPSNQSPLTSSFILAPPINVEEMAEYWTSKGCDCNIMFQRIRDYHTTNPVCEISNGKELAKIPGSQTIKSWDLATEGHKKKVFTIWCQMCIHESLGTVGLERVVSSIIAAVQQALTEKKKEEIVKEKAANTTAAEYYRLALMMEYPEYSALWTSAKNPSVARSQLLIVWEPGILANSFPLLISQTGFVV